MKVFTNEEGGNVGWAYFLEGEECPRCGKFFHEGELVRLTKHGTEYEVIHESSPCNEKKEETKEDRAAS